MSRKANLYISNLYEMSFDHSITKKLITKILLLKIIILFNNSQVKEENDYKNNNKKGKVN